jgi:uncharacterized DUF497 family protein
MNLRFEWNPSKAASNLRKHHVSFEEAATRFADPLSVTVNDPRHSPGEERFIVVGQSSNSRLLAVMFTERSEIIRIISARLATAHERREYEEGV